MKTIAKSLFTFLIFFQTAALYADDMRVMVDIVMGKDSDKELARRAAIACSEAVIQSKGFRYMSPTEVIKIMTGDEKIAVDKVADPRKEYGAKNMEYLDKVMAAYDGRSGDPFFNLLGSVDIIINNSVRRDGPMIRVELTMNNGKNQRQYDVVIESEENGLDDKVRKKVAHLLKKITEPVKVYADKLVSDKDSVVAYRVKAADNSDITINGNYTGDRPDPRVQDISILPPENVKKEGATTYQVKSVEGKPIDMEFAFRDGKLYSVKVDTPIPDPQDKSRQTEILTMKSDAGYALKFKFVWNNGDVESVQLDPELNPFGDYEE